MRNNFGVAPSDEQTIVSVVAFKQRIIHLTLPKNRLENLTPYSTRIWSITKGRIPITTETYLSIHLLPHRSICHLPGANLTRVRGEQEIFVFLSFSFLFFIPFPSLHPSLPNHHDGLMGLITNCQDWSIGTRPHVQEILLLSSQISPAEDLTLGGRVEGYEKKTGTTSSSFSIFLRNTSAWANYCLFCLSDIISETTVASVAHFIIVASIIGLLTGVHLPPIGLTGLPGSCDFVCPFVITGSLKPR